MKIRTIIYEDDNETVILDTGQYPENVKANFQIDDQQVVIENIVTPPTNNNG